MSNLRDDDAFSIATAVSTAISVSVRYAISRQYFTSNLEQILKCGSRPVSIGEVDFLHVTQVGRRPSSGNNQLTAAMETILSAWYLPGLAQYVFVALGDGARHDLFLGVRSLDEFSRPVEEMRERFADCLYGNVPGTRIVPEEQARLTQRLSDRLRYVVALTGIPSGRASGIEDPYGALDRFMATMRGKRYGYVVIANPLTYWELDTAIFACREMLGQLASLREVSLTDSLSVGATEGEQHGTTRQHSVALSEQESEGKTYLGVGAIASQAGAGLLTIGAALLSPVFPVAAFGAALKFLGAGALMSGASNFMPQSKQRGRTKGKTETWGEGETNTISRSLSQTVSHSIGKRLVNAHVDGAVEYLQHTLQRLERQRAIGGWNVSIFLLAETENEALLAGQQLCASLNGAESFVEPVRAHMISPILGVEGRQTICQFELPNVALIAEGEESLVHPLGQVFSGLSTPLSTSELAILTSLPKREISGIPVLEVSSGSLNPPVCDPDDSILLGPVLDCGELSHLQYALSLNTLCKHTLVTGISGSGKSTTIRRILGALQNRKKPIPFLVIEPAKEEYVEWAMEYNATVADADRRIAVYMPGAKTWNGQALSDTLALNPLDVVWLAPEQEPDITGHIDRLKSVFVSAFPMQEVLPVLMEDLIYYVYQQPPANWLGEQIPMYGTKYPSLKAMYDNIDKVLDKSYELRIRSNLIAALKTRLQGLRRGWKQTLFEPASGSSITWHELFGRPVVVNLSHLGDDADKCFTMSLLLLFLYEYRQAMYRTRKTQGSEGAPLQHLTVVEEAHRVMLRPTHTSVEQANPQAKTAEMFANILSEIRAYGEGLLIADQLPSRLVADAIKNTNLKIVHRLVANDDRETMAGCMTMTNEQMAVLNRLRPGQAFVFGDLDDMPAWVQVPYKK